MLGADFADIRQPVSAPLLSLNDYTVLSILRSFSFSKLNENNECAGLANVKSSFLGALKTSSYFSART